MHILDQVCFEKKKQKRKKERKKKKKKKKKRLISYFDSILYMFKKYVFATLLQNFMFFYDFVISNHYKISKLRGDPPHRMSL